MFYGLKVENNLLRTICAASPHSKIIYFTTEIDVSLECLSKEVVQVVDKNIMSCSESIIAVMDSLVKTKENLITIGPVNSSIGKNSQLFLMNWNSVDWSDLFSQSVWVGLERGPICGLRGLVDEMSVSGGGGKGETDSRMICVSVGKNWPTLIEHVFIVEK